MQDFFSAALPWIIMGLAVAVVLVYFSLKDKSNKKGDKK
jgi:hypothetical protein